MMMQEAKKLAIQRTNQLILANQQPTQKMAALESCQESDQSPNFYKLEKGDKAQAKWKHGHRWFNVVVDFVNDDGTYSLSYEDGDQWVTFSF